MAVLQAYKADLLKELDTAEPLTPEAIKELCQTFYIHQYKLLLDLMTAVDNVIPSGLLHIRPFKWWLKEDVCNPLSTLVFSKFSSSPEAGCHGTDVAEAASVRLFP